MSNPLPWESPQSNAPTGGGPERAELDAPVEEIKHAVSDAATTVADAINEVGPTVVNASITGGDYTISTTTMSGHQIKLADAKSRAFRTLFQNLGVDILVSTATVLPMLATMNFTDKTSWAIFGASIAKTVVNVFVSYVSRLTAEPVIPTPVETPGGQVVQGPPSPDGRHAKG